MLINDDTTDAPSAHKRNSNTQQHTVCDHSGPKHIHL